MSSPAGDIDLVISGFACRRKLSQLLAERQSANQRRLTIIKRSGSLIVAHDAVAENGIHSLNACFASKSNFDVW